jgi:hypothetical protein
MIEKSPEPSALKSKTNSMDASRYLRVEPAGARLNPRWSWRSVHGDLPAGVAKDPEASWEGEGARDFPGLIERAFIEQPRMGFGRKGMKIQAKGLFLSRICSRDIGRCLRPALHPAGEQLSGCGKPGILLLPLITMQIP